MLCPPHFHRVVSEWPCGQQTGGKPMNQIVYIVGLVVIVLVILGFFGLR
jgi:hypothetical protein